MEQQDQSSPAVATWNWPLDAINTPEDVLRWFKALMFQDDLGFHPDNSFGNYVNRDGSDTYTTEQVPLLTWLLHRCYEVCQDAKERDWLRIPGCIEQEYNDIYGLAIMANEAYCKHHGLPVPGADDDVKTMPILTLGFDNVMKHVDLMMVAAQGVDNLLKHIMAMADDAYLCMHPEWHELVKEARDLLDK